MKSSPGFTLIEVIISMTIMALVVTVLYYAFSLGVTTWNTQEIKSSAMERYFKVLKLLETDFSSMRPYTLQHEKGQFSFCHGSSSVFFYLTGNAFGAPERQEQGIYFTCLYLQTTGSEEKQSLFLYKTPRPGLELIESFIQFQQLDPAGKDSFQPDQAFREQSIRLLENVESEGFLYAAKRFESFQGDLAQNGTAGSVPSSADSFQDQWIANELPGQVRFQFHAAGRDYAMRASVPWVFVPEEDGT